MGQHLRNNSGKIDALDLIGERAGPKDFLECEAVIETNYGVDYDPEKFSMLWSMVKQEGWSAKRLKETVLVFIKNNKYPSWTVADFFEHGCKLYNYTQYMKELDKYRGLNEEIIWFTIRGVRLWGYTNEVGKYAELLGSMK